MLFYNEARVDGLSKREETPLEMTEHFQNREDFLYYQHIDLGPKPKKAGPKGSDLNPRPIYVSEIDVLQLFYHYTCYAILN